MTDGRHRIVRVRLDERTLVHRNPEVAHERALAIHDLLETNAVSLAGRPEAGPFALFLSMAGERLVFDLRDEDGEVSLAETGVALPALQGIVRDHVLIRESYLNAIRRSTPSQVDAIGAGRRALQDEGSEILRSSLNPMVSIDADTARRLFVLVAALHLRN
jgi:uncharacterized protein (UPF0262 family)